MTIKASIRSFAAQFRGGIAVIDAGVEACARPDLCGSDGLCPPCSRTRGDDYHVELLWGKTWRREAGAKPMMRRNAEKEARGILAARKRFSRLRAARVVRDDDAVVIEFRVL